MIPDANSPGGSGLAPPYLPRTCTHTLWRISSPCSPRRMRRGGRYWTWVVEAGTVSHLFHPAISFSPSASVFSPS
jgi:hypothetical protein